MCGFVQLVDVGQGTCTAGGLRECGMICIGMCRVERKVLSKVLFFTSLTLHK